jgi:CheY-like chemotaxis protein
VLVVEDSEDDAALLVRELRRGGYEPLLERVDTPEGMERALREAEGRGEPFEVVISDYHMPRFGAPDALALLRGLGHDVPFIVVSGKVGEDAAAGVLKPSKTPPRPSDAPWRGSGAPSSSCASKRRSAGRSSLRWRTSWI